MAKSLSEQILDIANKPVNQDFDIEDGEGAVFEHRDRNGSDDSDGLVSGDDEEHNDHYLQVGKSKLRKQDAPVLKDSKYQGTVGSRAQLYDEDDEDSLISESEEEMEQEHEQEHEQEAELQDSDALSFATDSEDQMVDGKSDSESEKEEDEDDIQEEEEAQREILSKLVKQETRHAVNKLSQSTKRDAAKGLMILHQSKVFESTIDTRIKLQKAVTSANQLPLTKESWNVYLKKSKDTKKLLKETTDKLNKVLQQLVDFRKEFQTSDGISKETETSSSTKRSFEDLCGYSKSLDKDLKNYRIAVLNKWSTKVASASGNTALSSSKFKAINQPADVQVENQLADIPRLVKRTCLNRRSVKPLNLEEDLEKNRLALLQNSSTVENDDDNGEDENPDIPKNYDPRRKDNSSIDTTENPYIFDDEDFYRVLLNDLVDRKISNAQNSQGSGATIAITSRSNNKLKKNVDTKASKGRKLNYSIQEQIANYEAPLSNGYKWSDEQIDEFFAGLLGQKVNFNEEEEGVVSEAEAEANAEELEAIKNDDIQIFG
ncbi:hypothetical protein Kpol_1004p75 [Vanderwaltozyma polyspora DSM 70294]|uniref:Protein BFR2 n=1 Tax=Vanderwaltozyma polyspora (strain ATCC 22028 / DSM 70294 / BCRC 21397 / CBS 2163 / NBRC 10782 / NRRL Y-8283 / UCD 57-17) TaxID=436907 RepID=A7TJC8_VANPO|nr:uncharacterized protein Kpol_1004p75 [Vanderwaltozyma polyspora DSM 70294]EDO17697.1 hypothetical protein Kpol_1004p75 [Vanderwaltozyma polyspora DSM 70294]